jgi:putative SOS response-associated peptidase YedK
MCGKVTQPAAWQNLVDLAKSTLADQIESARTDPGEPVVTVTPMRFANVIRLNADGARQSVAMRWGFSALSATNPGKPDHIHARAETIDSKPTFRDAFRERRGIMLVSTFNEGEEATPTKTIQHTITPRDGKPVAIAVLWEAWTRDEDELLTFVMVTTPANALIGKITDRMPAALSPEDWPAWLGETPATSEELKAMLHPFEGDWDMAPEKKQPPPKRPSAQTELF